MTIKDGTTKCPCGYAFDWKTFFLEKNEAAFFVVDEVQKNVIDKEKINGQYHITARCPKCGKKHFVVLEK